MDKKLSLSLCASPSDWEVAKKLRQRNFFDKHQMADPYTWTFDHPHHLHFLCNLVDKAMGYAHVQLWPEAKAMIRIIVVEEGLRGKGYGRQFLDLLEKEIGKRGYLAILTDASPKAKGLYERLGYCSMPFIDPDGYERDPRDAPMGKLLSRSS